PGRHGLRRRRIVTPDVRRRARRTLRGTTGRLLLSERRNGKRPAWPRRRGEVPVSALEDEPVAEEVRRARRREEAAGALGSLTRPKGAVVHPPQQRDPLRHRRMRGKPLRPASFTVVDA